MSKLSRFFCIGLLMSSGSAYAATFTDNVEVTQIGTYQYSSGHFVWFSSPIPECQATPHFDEASVGGKALVATLTTALLNKRKVAVRAEGCNITEIYLK